MSPTHLRRSGQPVSSPASGFPDNPNIDSPKLSTAPHARASPTETAHIDTLWAEIAQATRHDIKLNAAVAPNSSGCGCVDTPQLISVRVEKNGVPIPIHGHQWQLAHPDARRPEAVANVGYSAAQSPEQDCTNLLIHGIESGEGIFQFVSPRSHRSGRSTHGPSTIQMINT